MGTDFYMSLLLLVIGIFQIVAVRKKWRWYINHLHCRQMREEWGEDAFALTIYLSSAALIFMGFNGILRV